MPYSWTETKTPAPRAELHLWPYNALRPHGFAAMIAGFFGFATLPLIAVMGTKLFWGLLPFMMGATAALYYALRKNARDRQILEILELTPEQTSLTHRPARGPEQHWESPTYWVKPVMHPNAGPVPHYITLKGVGREVELGAFLSEDERKAVYADLHDRIRQMAGTG